MYYSSNSNCSRNLLTFHSTACTHEWIQSSRTECPEWCTEISFFPLWIYWRNGKGLYLCCNPIAWRCFNGQASNFSSMLNFATFTWQLNTICLWGMSLCRCTSCGASWTLSLFTMLWFSACLDYIWDDLGKLFGKYIVRMMLLLQFSFIITFAAFELKKVKYTIKNEWQD